MLYPYVLVCCFGCIFSAPVPLLYACCASGRAGAQNCNGGDTNSIAKIKNEVTADFWDEIEQNLTNILGSTGQIQNSAIKAAAAEGRFSINRQTGLIAVNANGRHHRVVANFISAVRRLARA